MAEQKQKNRPRPDAEAVIEQSERTSAVLENKIRGNQRRLLKSIKNLESRIISEFSVLQTTDRGRLVGPRVNLKKAQALHTRMVELFEEEYGRTVREQVSGYSEVADLIKDDFEEFGVISRYTDIDRTMMRQLGEQNLLEFTTIGRQAQEKITQSMYNMVAAGAPYDDLVKEITAALVGQVDARGRPLTKYAELYANDGIMNFYNSVHVEKARQSGMEYMMYMGTIMATTRDFCATRVMKAYSIEEINSWDFAWSGKRGPALAYRGGWNCRHHWRAVKKSWLKGLEDFDIGAPPPGWTKPEGGRGWDDFEKAAQTKLAGLRAKLRKGVKIKEGTPRVKFWQNELNDAERQSFIAAWESEGLVVDDVLKKGVKPPVKPPKPPSPKPPPVKPPKPPEPVVVKPDLEGLDRKQRVAMTRLEKLETVDEFGSPVLKGPNVRSSIPLVREEVFELEDELAGKIKRARELDAPETVKTVKIAELKGVQDFVEKDRMRGLIRANFPEGEELPIIVRHDGELILWNGYHRAEAKLLLKRKTIKARIVDLDALDGGKLQPTPVSPTVTPAKLGSREQLKKAWDAEEKRIADIKKTGKWPTDEDYDRLFNAEVNYYNVLPWKELQQRRIEILDKMTIFEDLAKPGHKKSLLRQMEKGSSHVPYRLLRDMDRHGLRIWYWKGKGRASFNAGRSEQIRVFGGSYHSTAEQLAHEMGHAIDSFMGNGGRSFGSRFGRWTNNPYSTEEEAVLYRKLYDNQKFAGMPKGTFHNGDGQYWKGKWMVNYEGRIYNDGGVAHQWFSMAIERFNRAFTSFRSDLFDNQVSTLSQRIRNKAHALKGFKKGSADYNQTLGLLNSYKADLDKIWPAGKPYEKAKWDWAMNRGIWANEKKHYPEFAQWIEDFFARINAMDGRVGLDYGFKHAKQSKTLKVKKEVDNIDIESLL